MPRPRLFFVALVLLSALAACAGTAPTTTGFTPITGVLVRAESLVNGIGCGKADTQVFKYAVVLTQGDVTIKDAGGVFDCFADAKFANLAPGPDGTLSFTVNIYAFNRASFEQQNAGGALVTAAKDWKALQTFKPTYKTTCSATQQQDVEVLAVCAPLTPGGPASVRLSTASFKRKTGGDLSCGAYGKAKVLFRVDSDVDAGVGAQQEVTCPADVVISPAQAPATYTLDAVLLDSSGAVVVATARCHATTAPGQETLATCDPAE